jgi:hypothetical protein
MPSNHQHTIILPPARHSYLEQGPFDTEQALATDASGWPTSLPPGTIAHKLAVRNVRLKAVPGRYVALYDGQGRVDFGFDAKVGPCVGAKLGLHDAA